MLRDITENGSHTLSLLKNENGENTKRKEQVYVNIFTLQPCNVGHPIPITISKFTITNFLKGK